MTISTRRDRGAVLLGGPFLLGLVLVSLAANRQEPKGRTETDDKGRTASTPERLVIPGIENTFRLGPKLYSGGDPRGTEALAALKALGIKTIISVDGAVPDVETARKLGLRYVHLPIGYDGVPRDQAVRIIKAARTLPGPVYVHCHHGKHRGPAAAAVCGLASEGWTEDQALAWLKQAGTAPEYRGLFDAAKGFVPPSTKELERAGTEFPERADVPDFVETMVRVDEHWDRMKAIRKAGFKPPPDQPDVDPPHEALQLAERFREALRSDEVKAKDAAFVEATTSAERRATALEHALRGYVKTPTDAARRAAEEAFLAVSASCTGCHRTYRDNRMR